MKIILTANVKGHGKKGEIITVKDGFGMNYLIKNQLGILADSSGMKKLNTEIRKKEEEVNQLKEEAINLKNQLEKIHLIFKVKTGSSDKVFGSISQKQIENELKNKGFNIDKKKIIIDFPLICLGIYNVKVNLYKEIIGEIKVELQKESR
ncbi:MAG: 50S ribosomal protein L9 [Bacilli bacterium]